MKVLIVDDEALARQRVRGFLEKEKDVEILGECSNGAEAIVTINEKKPDLVLLDIQMPEADGFEVLRGLEEPLPLVIFVTAYDTHAVKAFEHHALDYLLKPFKPARFKESIERARKQLEAKAGGDAGAANADTAKLLALLGEQLKAGGGAGVVSRIAVRSSDRIRFIPVTDIHWIEADGNYAILHTATEKHIIRETLASLESKLPEKEFLRVNRSAIVNLQEVREAQPTFNGEHVVILKNGVKQSLTLPLRELQAKLSTL